MLIFSIHFATIESSSNNFERHFFYQIHILFIEKLHTWYVTVIIYTPVVFACYVKICDKSIDYASLFSFGGQLSQGAEGERLYAEGLRTVRR